MSARTCPDVHENRIITDDGPFLASTDRPDLATRRHHRTVSPPPPVSPWSSPASL
jgi:hypothetical protein